MLWKYFTKRRDTIELNFDVLFMKTVDRSYSCNFRSHGDKNQGKNDKSDVEDI